MTYHTEESSYHSRRERDPRRNTSQDVRAESIRITITTENSSTSRNSRDSHGHRSSRDGHGHSRRDSHDTPRPSTPSSRSTATRRPSTTGSFSSQKSNLSYRIIRPSGYVSETSNMGLPVSPRQPTHTVPEQLPQRVYDQRLRRKLPSSPSYKRDEVDSRGYTDAHYIRVARLHQDITIGRPLGKWLANKRFMELYNDYQRGTVARDSSEILNRLDDIVKEDDVQLSTGCSSYIPLDPSLSWVVDPTGQVVETTIF